MSNDGALSRGQKRRWAPGSVGSDRDRSAGPQGISPIL